MKSASTAQFGPPHSPVATDQPESPLPRSVGLWQDIPRDLSVAWLAIAPLYVVGPGGLPEPIIALAVGTTVGLASAVLKAGMRKETRQPQTGQPQTGQPQYAAPGATRRPYLSPPRKSPTPSAAAMENTDGDGGSLRTPAAQPPEVEALAPLEFESYGSAAATETQCPHCGSFNTEQNGTGSALTANCHTCRHSWATDDAAPPPDVVVRSWLSQRNSTPE